MSTKAKTESELIEATAGVVSAGGLRSEPGGRAQQPAGGAPSAAVELPQEVRDRLSDELIDELLAGARTEEEIVGPGGVLEAEVEIAGVRRTVQLFLMRACYSGAAFVMAFGWATQQAFLEAHVEAFRFFGGSFAVVRYDNLRAAVKQMLRGRRRKEQDRFVALRSHYLFESLFTRKGREGAHEKGGVEGEVGRHRRRWLVPVPKVGSLNELNNLLEDSCFRELERRIVGRSETVGEALRLERPLLRELPFEDFDASEQASPRVDATALVTIPQKRYSVPVCLVGLRVAARITAREIVISQGGRPVARHARLHAAFRPRRSSTTTSSSCSASPVRSRARCR